MGFGIILKLIFLATYRGELFSRGNLKFPKNLASKGIRGGATTESSPYWAVGAAAISGVASENEPFFKKIWKYFFVPNIGLAFKSKRILKKYFF